VRPLAVALVVLALVACGGRATPDDKALHQDVVNDSSGAEVTFDATVLNSPVDSGGHERFEVKATTGEVLEIDHNIDLAAAAPIHIGDHVVIHGQLYIDPGPKVGVHCTHAATSSGCPIPGWIMFGNNYFE
jgi:phage baseplate assembly protein gpV